MADKLFHLYVFKGRQISRKPRTVRDPELQALVRKHTGVMLELVPENGTPSWMRPKPVVVQASSKPAVQGLYHVKESGRAGVVVTKRPLTWEMAKRYARELSVQNKRSYQPVPR